MFFIIFINQVNSSGENQVPRKNPLANNYSYSFAGTPMKSYGTPTFPSISMGRFPKWVQMPVTYMTFIYVHDYKFNISAMTGFPYIHYES